MRGGGAVVPGAGRGILAGDDERVRKVRVPSTTSFARACGRRRFLLVDRTLGVVRYGRTSLLGLDFAKAAANR